jgi:hypothetical protein
MAIALIVFAATLVSGWLVARALTAGAWSGPRWASLLVELALGALFGPGLASVLYSALLAMGAANRASVIGMSVALLAASAALTRLLGAGKAGSTAALPKFPSKFPWMWALWIGVGVGLVFFVLDFQAASGANPAGEWDAMSIWNLRAHYLASGGDLWRRAVSAELGGNLAGSTHPGYPLFLSGFIGLQWAAAGNFDEAVPIAASFLFAVGALLLLGASLASRRSPALGLLAWLVLLASEVFASQAASQYSDLLQGLAFLSALVLLDAATEHTEPRVLAAAGLAIGLSCWIKNEGLPFAAAAICVAAWRFGSRVVWLAVGALPGLLATAVLKLFVAQGGEAVFPHSVGEAMGKIAGAGRWWQAALGFAKAVYDAGNWWTHPVLLAVLLALALHFVPPAEVRQRMWLLIPIGATATAEYGLYLVTTADLNWHISTSVSRLVAQLWPSLIWLFFMLLRAPEGALPLRPAPALAGAAPGGRRKRR